jgi:hypothetical protein
MTCVAFSQAPASKTALLEAMIAWGRGSAAGGGSLRFTMRLTRSTKLARPAMMMSAATALQSGLAMSVSAKPIVPAEQAREDHVRERERHVQFHRRWHRGVR